jgi:prolipoprotein diacylglyceryltransferase
MGLLALAFWVAYRQWIMVDADVPAWALISMAFGALMAVLVGGGLMALIFYSSRKGYDEPPHQIKPPEDEV